MFCLKMAFRGTHICDQCDASSDSIQALHHASNFKRKTRPIYQFALSEVQRDSDNFSLHGIHSDCKLNRLQYFHSTANYSMDIMVSSPHYDHYRY